MARAEATVRSGLWRATAAAFALALPVLSHAAEVDQNKVWPEVGGWRTALVDAGGLRFCVSNYASKKDADSRSFSISFGGRSGDTLSLGDFGPARSRPGRLRLILDGAPLGELAVVNVQDFDNGVIYDARLADLPKAGGFPDAWTRSRTLVILAGSAAYTLPLDSFAAAHRQMAECLVEEARRNAGQAATHAFEAAGGPPPPPAPDLARLDELDPLTVQSAAVDMVLLDKRRGMMSLIDRSESCFADLEVVASSEDVDRCVAFDEAVLLDWARRGVGDGIWSGDYFTRAAVTARTTRAMSRLTGLPERKAAHLKALTDAVPDALRRALLAIYPDEKQPTSAAPARLMSEKPKP